MYETLPQVKDKNIALPHFPTRMQAFIFRAWETVPAARIASVLETSEDTVCEEAKRMGLPHQNHLENWRTRGYITIIRSMWHILPYNQLLPLLDMREEDLAYLLKEDDFLGIKLGGYKPLCQPLIYRPLTARQIAATAHIRSIMEQKIRIYDNMESAAPFDFYTPRYPSLPTVPLDYPIVLTDDWYIEGEIDPLTELFVVDFQTLWGIDLRSGGNKKICLHVNADFTPEYHEVVIEETHITVTAGSNVGIFRGLMFLTDLSKTAGGPRYMPKHYKRTPQFRTRMIYSYSGLYGNVFDAPPTASYPEALLQSYARLGINGIWAQAVLYRLLPFPFDPTISAGWQERLANLKALVALAKQYGIQVYLYLNEPRALPNAFFERYPDLRGHQNDKGETCLCTSNPAVINYLRDAVATLCTKVPDIGGFFTITVSENMTNCYSRAPEGKTNCPRCALHAPEKIIAAVNHAIAQGAQSVNPAISVTAWSWSWSWMTDWEHASGAHAPQRCILETDTSVSIMMTAEEKLPFEIANCKGTVADYTLSLCGPSDYSRAMWKTARESGHACAAKIQINNTWECASVPFIPVYGRIKQLMRSLQAEKIDDIMLSWTLGGYPSDNIKLAASMFFDDTDVDVLKNLYGNSAPMVKEATDRFCAAFSEFPFSLTTLYFGPQNAGAANLLYEKPTGMSATMTCYTYDDIEHWRDRTVYSAEVWEEQMRRLRDKWAQGLALLRDLPPCDMLDAAQAADAIWRSCVNQIQFVRAREAADNENMRAAITDELDTATALYRVMLRNPCIGYEAANHYYYSRYSLIEKVINCAYLLSVL